MTLQGQLPEPKACTWEESAASGRDCTHAGGALTGISLGDHLGSQLPPKLAQPDTGQDSGPSTGFFTGLWPSTNRTGYFLSSFLSVACPPQALAQVLGSLGQWVPAPGTTHHARELPLWWWCRLLWAWGEDSRAQVWNTVLGQPLLPALLPRARPPDQDSTLGSTLELLTAQCLWKDHQTGNQKKGFWVPFCPSVGLWPHSVPRINVSGLPLPDVTSELPSKYSSFLPTPFPALKTVSSWQHLEPPGPGHSHLSLFLAPPSPNPSQMPLLPGSQVAGLRPGGGRAGRRVRGRPQS